MVVPSLKQQAFNATHPTNRRVKYFNINLLPRSAKAWEKHLNQWHLHPKPFGLAEARNFLRTYDSSSNDNQVRLAASLKEFMNMTPDDLRKRLGFKKARPVSASVNRILKGYKNLSNSGTHKKLNEYLNRSHRYSQLSKLPVVGPFFRRKYEKLWNKRGKLRNNIETKYLNMLPKTVAEKLAVKHAIPTASTEQIYKDPYYQWAHSKRSALEDLYWNQIILHPRQPIANIYKNAAKIILNQWRRAKEREHESYGPGGHRFRQEMAKQGVQFGLPPKTLNIPKLLREGKLA